MEDLDMDAVRAAWSEICSAQPGRKRLALLQKLLDRIVAAENSARRPRIFQTGSLANRVRGIAKLGRRSFFMEELS